MSSAITGRRERGRGGANGGCLLAARPEAIVDPLTAGLALASLVLLLRFRVNSVWLVLGGGVSGLLARMLSP